jgi:hypothetical protein
MVESTYWPSDKNKLLDLVNFSVKKGISQDFAVAISCCDLSSDHSQVLIPLTEHVMKQENQSSLGNRHTNWEDFRRLRDYHYMFPLKLKKGVKQQ